MAARRVSKTAVDWAAFYERIPVREREVYKALKSRSEYFVNRVHSNPETLPKVEFSQYKAMLPGLKMVDDFEKSYGAVKVPYPTDKDNVANTIAQEEAKTLVESKNRIKQMEGERQLSDVYLGKLKELPTHADFTMEMLYEYFPWVNPLDPQKPKMFPFTKDSQPDHMELNDTKFLNGLLAKVGIKVKI